MKRSVIWFKTDLRLHDNETLIRALDYSDEIIPVYCIDESHFKKTAFGTFKTGVFRTRFLLEALHDLNAQLRNAGSGLLIVKGDPAVEIPKVARQYNASRVYAKKEVAFEEKELEERVEKELWKMRCTLETFSVSTLFHAEDLPYSIRDIPDVFTAFRKKTERETTVRDVFPKPIKIVSPTLPMAEIPELSDFGFQNPEHDARASFKFQGGESAALQRVQHYFEGTGAVSSYKQTRNALTGTDYSSGFSPWLAIGCLSPREIYSALKTYEQLNSANESTYWLFFELMWRDYFRFMMKKHRNRLFRKSGIRGNTEVTGIHRESVFDHWKEGNTGNEFIDACMNELNHTGFLSNRARQNVAAYFCDELKLDWRYGAAYFEQQLIDYDVCSNWGNWAYIAGVGNDPRGKRFFNLEKQVSEYDKNGEYRKLWKQ